MTDIVDRLRAQWEMFHSPVILEAADEIERLRRAGFGGLSFDIAEKQRQEIERLTTAVNMLLDGTAMRDAEIERLRAALEDILDDADEACITPADPMFVSIQRVARRALTGRERT